MANELPSGFWRFHELYERLGLRPTLSINARVCTDYPRVASACRDAGWEFMGHSWEQGPIHLEQDQRSMISRSMDTLERFTGKRPVGWLGPGLTQTLETLSTKTEEIDQRLRGYSANLEGSFNAAEARARTVGEQLTRSAEERSRIAASEFERLQSHGSGDTERALAKLPAKALAQRALSVCSGWPKGARDAAATTPVRSDVPVLILSGGLDPVTPPANGAEVAKTLPKSRHIVARGYGHIVSPHACGPRLVAAFVDDPTFATLPASCVDHFEKSVRPPLWPDRLGARS